MSAEVILNVAALNELFKSPSGPAAAYLTKIAMQVEARAKDHCPVDTGRLRGSITHEISAEGNTLVARIGSNVEYAAYQELGTSRMSAHPYLRPALTEVTG